MTKEKNLNFDFYQIFVSFCWIGCAFLHNHIKSSIANFCRPSHQCGNGYEDFWLQKEINSYRSLKVYNLIHFSTEENIILHLSHTWFCIPHYQKKQTSLWNLPIQLIFAGQWCDKKWSSYTALLQYRTPLFFSCISILWVPLWKKKYTKKIGGVRYCNSTKLYFLLCFVLFTFYTLVYVFYFVETQTQRQ